MNFNRFAWGISMGPEKEINSRLSDKSRKFSSTICTDKNNIKRKKISVFLKFLLKGPFNSEGTVIFFLRSEGAVILFPGLEGIVQLWRNRSILKGPSFYFWGLTGPFKSNKALVFGSVPFSASHARYCFRYMAVPMFHLMKKLHCHHNVAFLAIMMFINDVFLPEFVIRGDQIIKDYWRKRIHR